jgi:GAF domain-containing protein
VLGAPGSSEIEPLLRELLARSGASRVTLRRGSSGDYAFPVTDEAVAPGVRSLREERTVDLAAQPVVREVRRRRQVVQDDCRTAYDDPAFQRMLDTYGGLAAQIVTPVVAKGEVAGILSVHQLATPRQWTQEEASACRQAAARIAELL